LIDFPVTTRDINENLSGSLH